jgi:M6 family metalloprotease-like protein
MWKHRLRGSVFFCLIAVAATPVVSQLGFEEVPWAGVQIVNPIDTVHAVAIYACPADSSDDLPYSWASVWDTTPDVASIPNYYKDVSFGKHRLTGDPYGRDSTHCFVSFPYTGVAVGDSGEAVTTTNLETWQERNTGTETCVNAVSFSDAYRGFAVGDSGLILRTTDHGVSWTTQTSPTAIHLNGVHSHRRSVHEAFAVGDSGTILGTADAGHTWTAQTCSVEVDLHGVSFTPETQFYDPSGKRGVAVGDSGAIVVTSSSGAHWLTISSGTTHDLYGVEFSWDNGVFAVGDSGTILRSTQGYTWQAVSSGVVRALYGVDFVDSLTGLVVGDSGTILRTADGGSNWEVLSSGTVRDLRAVRLASADVAVAVGDSGLMLRTQDGGDHWDTLSSETTKDLRDVALRKIEMYKDECYDFTWDILTRADSLIDFADFDSDDDDTVDMVFLLVLGFSGYSRPLLWIRGDVFPTNDTSASGDTIRVTPSRGMTNKIVSEENVLALPIHEYGHLLGLPDYYWFNIPVRGSGLGSFEPMTARGFQGLPSPFNPWFRSDYAAGSNAPFHWLTPVQVTSSLFSQPIQDITSGKVYELVSELVVDSVISGPRFLVTNHQRFSQWERNWPTKGLMIWHVFNDPNRSNSDSYRKTIDLEAPHGLWCWDTTSADTHIVYPDPVHGLDSLDVAGVAWNPGDDGIGSATCIYRLGIDTAFDAFTNPSSDEYNPVTVGAETLFFQNIASHIAIRNFDTTGVDTFVVRADLIVNQVESDNAAATGQNNGRRWLLDPDETAMHLVYASKGRIYYTTTDSNKVWYPAIPIGEGSYPALDLENAGDPAVIWIQQGVCNVTPSRIVFARKTGGSWTAPDTLHSISEELGPPSFVIDTLDLGHIAYKVHLCEQNGNSEIHYGTFDIASPDLQDTALDASGHGCGNASIGYTPYLNSVHVVWEKESKIWHTWKDAVSPGSGWHMASMISAQDTSETPSIDVLHDTVHVVWASKVGGGKSIIRYRRKTGSTWGSISSPSDTSLVTARQPIVVHGPGGLYAVWAEIPTGSSHSDIIYAEWDSLGWQRMGNFCTSPITDDYPQALQRPMAGAGNPVGLEVAWTSGNSLPFHVANSVASLRGRGGGGGQSAGLRSGAPRVFALKHPFPSPFVERAVLRYQVPYAARVTLRVFDLAGRLIRTVVDAQETPGYHTAEWIGEDDLGRSVSGGVYFARFESGKFTATRKMVLLR